MVGSIGSGNTPLNTGEQAPNCPYHSLSANGVNSSLFAVAKNLQSLTGWVGGVCAVNPPKLRLEGGAPLVERAQLAASRRLERSRHHSTRWSSSSSTFKTCFVRTNLWGSSRNVCLDLSLTNKNSS